jgi:menaquinone-dependent protoporphyrinogen oxidase
MVTAMRAPVGDSRDWAAVGSWAEEIAAALSMERPEPGTTHGHH